MRKVVAVFSEVKRKYNGTRDLYKYRVDLDYIVGGISKRCRELKRFTSVKRANRYGRKEAVRLKATFFPWPDEKGATL